MKLLLRIIGYLAIIAGVLVAAFIVWNLLSPKPAALFIRSQFDKPASKPAQFTNYQQKVKVKKNLHYPSKNKNNTLDIYYPKQNAGKKATIFWVHGGAFVGGDKKDLKYWSTMMASKGYTVVSINYQLAPEAVYPVPIKQMMEAYDYLEKNEQKLPMLTLKKLVIGGDSAGAQMASQFVAIQTDAAYAKKAGFKQVVPKQTIKAALLYCGPYNLKELMNVKGAKLKFFLKRVGWAYLGDRSWQTGKKAALLSTAKHVSKAYPATFITDANTGSFEKQGKELEKTLKSKKVPVTSLYFSKKSGKTYHEYQFDFKTKESKIAFQQTLQFLDKTVK